jgi:hypothetical protein
MTIGIHVLGPGYGESIVVELPDGQWGIIDSFRMPLGPVPLPELLRRHFNISALLFLAVTHPHADHCVGVEQLLRDFPCTELWVFDAILEQDLCDYYRELMYRALSDPVGEDLDLKPETTLHELENLRENILARWAANPKQKFRLLRGAIAPFTLCGGAVTVRCLTPGDGSLVHYREQLKRILATILARVAAARPHSRGLWQKIVHIFESIPWARSAADPVPSVNQNLASSALLMEYGDTRLLFMADAERPLWEDWDRERGSCEVLTVKGIHFLKVAHHGSLNGCFDALYLAACTAAPPVAVLTPFSRSRSPLPSGDGLRQIQMFVPKVLCTNRFVAEISSGLNWAPPAGGSALPNLPPAWITDIRRERRLVRLLAPPYGDPARVPRGFGVPRRWLRDLRVRPELRELLHPGLRGLPLPGTPPTPHNEHIVSIYFDDKGREVRRQLGRNTGTL